MSGYQEHAPAAALAERVECIWTGASGPLVHRVLPDGCIDVLYTRQGSKSRLEVVGAMTRFLDYTTKEEQANIGVRFRPGGLSGFAGSAYGEWTDQALELASISGRDARYWKQRLDDEPTPHAMHQLVSELMTRLPNLDGVQQAINHLSARHGEAELAWLAKEANLSERQFRRLCQSRTGLGPKQLARILRFRRAHALCRQTPLSLTDVALECGYYDQAHFIHDFEEYSGQTPGEVRHKRPAQQLTGPSS